MPKPKTIKQIVENRGNGGVSFAEIRILKDDSDAFFAWTLDAMPTTEEMLVLAAEDSYRITIKADYKNKCFQCTWTINENEKHKNDGVILISRAGSPEEALALNFYKTYVLYPEQPWPIQRETSDWG